MITKFSLFEARFSDEMNILKTPDTNLSNLLKDYKDKKLEIEREFQKYFTIGKKKMRFHVEWNQNNQHDIYSKIQQRHISVKSITELNNKIKLIIEEIPSLIDEKEIYASGNYGIILTESKFVVIMFIDLKKYFNKEYEIKIRTILPISPTKGVINDIYLPI